MRYLTPRVPNGRPTPQTRPGRLTPSEVPVLRGFRPLIGLTGANGLPISVTVVPCGGTIFANDFKDIGGLHAKVVLPKVSRRACIQTILCLFRK